MCARQKEEEYRALGVYGSAHSPHSHCLSGSASPASAVSASACNACDDEQQLDGGGQEEARALHRGAAVQDSSPLFCQSTPLQFRVSISIDFLIQSSDISSSDPLPREFLPFRRYSRRAIDNASPRPPVRRVIDPGGELAESRMNGYRLRVGRRLSWLGNLIAPEFTRPSSAPHSFG